MLELVCSTCGTRVQGDDSVAGERVRCPSCHAEMTVPTASAIVTPEHAEQTKLTTTPAGSGAFQDGPPPMPARRSASPESLASRLPGSLSGYIAAFVIVGSLIAILIPVVQKVRHAAARTQSINNLKQIGRAIHGFHDTNKRFPFNGCDQDLTRNGGPNYTKAAKSLSTESGSWLFQLVPFMESVEIFIELPADRGIQTYLCPGRGRPSHSPGSGPWSDYHINILLNANDKQLGFDVPDVKRTLVGTTDGTSNTIFAGNGYIDRDHYSETGNMGNFSGSIYVGGTEATGRGLGMGKLPPNIIFFPNRPWDGPEALCRQDAAAEVLSDRWNSPMPWGGPFSQGFLCVWCDGTVRIVPFSTAPKWFGAFLTPNGADGPYGGPD